jgi:hypothetical protein
MQWLIVDHYTPVSRAWSPRLRRWKRLRGCGAHVQTCAVMEASAACMQGGQRLHGEVGAAVFAVQGQAVGGEFGCTKKLAAEVWALIGCRFRAAARWAGLVSAAGI